MVQEDMDLEVTEEAMEIGLIMADPDTGAVIGDMVEAIGGTVVTGVMVVDTFQADLP